MWYLGKNNIPVFVLTLTEGNNPAFYFLENDKIIPIIGLVI